MRDSYREQLDDVLADLVHMAQVVSSAVRSATTALLEADIHLAEQVIGDDARIDAKQAEIEGRAFSLLARQCLRRCARISCGWVMSPKRW